MMCNEKYLDDFQLRGCCGPFPIDVEPQIVSYCYDFIRDMVEHSYIHPIYGRYSSRDWHLVVPQILELMTSKRLLAKLRAIMGGDLVLWRSKVFYKKPGEGPLGWHQEWGPFNGEEIGNDKPSLVPEDTESRWNISVWFALHDISESMAPIRFASGTHNTRFPIEMSRLRDSEFFVDPFKLNTDGNEIVRAAKRGTLLLDFDTKDWFDSVDATKITALQDEFERRIAGLRAAKTIDFNADEYEIWVPEFKSGESVIFTERVMHGSAGNHSNLPRVAINAWYTLKTTEIYPFKKRGDNIDGSNLNIEYHRVIQC